MRFLKSVSPLVAVVAVALSSGCAMPAAEDSSPGESVGQTTQAAGTSTSTVDLVSGGFGTLSGLMTAYTNIDNLSRYGTTNLQGETLTLLRDQRVALNNLQASQDAQFNQVKIDIATGPINDSENKIARAFDAWYGLAAKGDSSYAPTDADLTWGDIDVLYSRVVGSNGTSSALQLIAEKMLTASALTDPLGTYAVRMRMRLAQGTFLMSKKAPLTDAELARYAGQVEQLNVAFANAMRGYFQKRVEPIEGNTGVATQCSTQPGAGYPFYTPTRYYFTVNNGADNSQTFATIPECESARKSWQFQSAWQTRRDMVNKMYLDQESFRGWKKRKNTIHVNSATLQGNDVTYALTFMCNTQETCSFTGSSVANRLGFDASKPVGDLEIDYECVDTLNGGRFVTVKPGVDGVLSCKIERAVAGEYVNTANDATGVRRPEDQATLLATSANALSWTDRGNVNDGTLRFYEGPFNTIAWTSSSGSGGSSKVLPLAWGDAGVPLSIVGPNGATFTYVSPPKVVSAPPPGFVDYAL